MTTSAGTGPLLLDTHVLLWWLAGDTALPKDVRNTIATETEVFVSVVTLWEIALKRAIGKLEVPDDLVDWVEASGVAELPVRFHHADAAGQLPFLHRDPFDRMLVAQAITERLTLVTRDRQIQQYDVPTLKV